MMPHEKVGRLVKVLGILSVVVMALIFAAVAIPVYARPTPEHTPIALIPLLAFFIIPVILIFMGGAIKRHEEWGRVGGLIYGAFLLIGFPIGTLLGGYILWNLIKHWELAPAA